MGVKILSLYDGMACGMIAMQLAGVDVESYDAYEIDKYAIKTAQHNFPMIKEHGDVFDADFTQYEGVDFLIGGSPCTYWSIAQTKNRETVASGMGWELFSQYVRALHEAKPKYFIYENNKSMSKQIRASIDKAFGFEAVLINSALVSAQNRQRLYWVGRRNEDGSYSKVNVEQPADRGILLKDVLDSAVARDLTCNDKSYTLTASYDGACAWNVIERHQRNMVAERIPSYATEKSRPLSASYSHKGDGEGSLKCDAFPDNPNKQVFDFVAEPINVTEDGKSQTLKAQYCKNSVANFCCYSSTYGASGVAEPVNTDANGKAFCVTSRYYKGFGNNPGKCLEKHRDSMAAEPVCVAERGRMYCGQPQHYEARTDGKTNTLTSVEKDNRVAEPINDIIQVGAMPRPDGEISTSAGFRIYSTEAKGRYLCANGGGAGAKTGLYAIPYEIEFDDDGRPIKAIGKDGKEITIYEVKDGKISIKDKQYPIKLKDGYYIIRKLTVNECKRLQTVPEWYEFPVSNSQAYKMLGNGWTCEVIAHLIRSRNGRTMPGKEQE